MKDSSDDLNVREWKYDQQDPHEVATQRKNRKKQQQQQPTGLTEDLLKQIFPS